MKKFPHAVSTYNPLEQATQYDCVMQCKPINSGIMYWNNEHGIQFLHHPSNEKGFAGDKFKFRLEDGSSVIVKGPWSSRAEVVREHCDPNFVGYNEELIDNQYIVWYCPINRLLKTYDLKTQQPYTWHLFHNETGDYVHAGTDPETITNHSWHPVNPEQDNWADTSIFLPESIESYLEGLSS